MNLTLRRGEFVFLTGLSGSGKTSLLRVLALLQIPSAGRLTMFGEDVAQLRGERRAALRRRIGVVFQDVRLLDHLSTLDNVALPLRINGGRGEQIHTCASDMLKWLGLADFIGARPAALSMGQRQLVSVARAVIARPSLLLCDEPTNNIDGKLAGQLMHLFAQLCKLGTTVILATQRGSDRALLSPGRTSRRRPPDWDRAARLGIDGSRLSRVSHELAALRPALRQSAASRFLPWTIGGLLYLALSLSPSPRSPMRRCGATACTARWSRSPCQRSTMPA